MDAHLDPPLASFLSFIFASSARAGGWLAVDAVSRRKEGNGRRLDVIGICMFLGIIHYKHNAPVALCLPSEDMYV